jgi:hypothetical protein
LRTRILKRVKNNYEENKEGETEELGERKENKRAE